MKQYLLFAGRANTNASGVHGFVGDFDSFTEAFVSLVDRQTPSEWWHILDTKTGEVVERKHLKVHNGMIGFERSHWVVGQPSKEEPIALPAPVAATSELKLPEIDSIEADLHAVLTNGLKNGPAKENGPAKGANGKANGAAAEH
jgi:hypothetical protein